MSAPTSHVAAGDCEHCRPGLLAQPANAASSLAYVGAGALMVRAAAGHEPRRRPIERAVGWATVAAGLGSVAYHGPGGPLGHYAHDASLIAMFGLVAVADVAVIAPDVEVPPAVLVAVPVIAAWAASPRRSMVAQGVVAGLAISAEVARMAATREAPPGSGRRWQRWAELPAFGVGGALHLLGRSGGPLCRPDSPVQPHAVWHALTAFTLWLRASDAAT